MKTLHEPPTADPHGGWCGGWGLEASGYPISEVIGRARKSSESHSENIFVNQLLKGIDYESCLTHSESTFGEHVLSSAWKTLRRPSDCEC